MAMQETEAAPEAQPIDKLYMRTHFCVPPARCFAMTPSAIARSAIRSKYRRIAKRIIFASSRTPTTGDQARSLTKFSSHLSRGTPIMGGPCSLTCHSLNASSCGSSVAKSGAAKIAKSFREHYTKSAEPRSPHFSIPTIDTLNAISISSTSSILSGAIPIPIRSSCAGLRSPNRLSNRSAILHFTCLNHFLMRRLGCPPV